MHGGGPDPSALGWWTLAQLYGVAYTVVKRAAQESFDRRRAPFPLKRRWRDIVQVLDACRIHYDYSVIAYRPEY